MPVGWAIAVVVLWVAVVALAVILLGVLRQAIPVLERAAAGPASDVLKIGPQVGSQLPPLNQLRAQRAVLLFLTPGCGPCKILADEMNRVDLSGLTDQLVIITSPDGPNELGIPAGLPILTEQDREISDPLSVTGTPFAIAVAQDGVITAARVPHAMKEVMDLATALN